MRKKYIMETVLYFLLCAAIAWVIAHDIEFIVRYVYG